MDLLLVETIFDTLNAKAAIVAIKEETGDIRRVTDIFNAVGNRFQVFCGVDDLILESMALGAVASTVTVRVAAVSLPASTKSSQYEMSCSWVSGSPRMPPTRSLF